MALLDFSFGDSEFTLLRKMVQNQVEQGQFSGGSVSSPSTLNIYVDPINGVDAVGKGTLTAPYQTINFAYSQIALVSATIAGQVKWCNEKIVFVLATGVYNENVVTGWKRARVAIVGYGAKIVGTLKHQALLADFPFGGQVGVGFYLVANNPAPWNLFSPFQTFELIGEGGGVDSAFSSMGLMVTGQVTMDYQDSVGAGALSWQGRFSLSNFLCRSVSLLAGMNLVSFDNNIGMTMQVDSSTIEGGSVGVLPRSGTLITVAGQTTSIALVAHNSQITTIGAGVRLLQLDRCRLSNLDRTTGGVTDGFIIGSSSSSSSGIANTVFPGGSTFKIGFSAVATVPVFTFDSNSANRFFTGHTIDIGLSASVTYNLQDHSTYVKYPPTVPGNWPVVPTQVTDALDSLAANSLKVAGYIVRETPAGAVDGVNLIFTLAFTPVVGTEMVFQNGTLQTEGGGNDYTIAGATITFVVAPLVGAKLRTTYIK